MKTERKGFIVADAIVGLAIVTFIAALLATGIGRANKASNRLADSRQAVRLAEQTLETMQGGRSVAQSAVQIVRLTTPSETPGMTWVSVKSTVNGRSAELVGLVPEKSIPATGGKP